MTENDNYKAVLFDVSQQADYDLFNKLVNQKSTYFLYDSIQQQIEDLVKCRMPELHAAKDKQALQEEVKRFTADIDINRYGVWVFYPWSGRAIHLLPEKEFTEVRTNRNRMKITLEEQATLALKKVGVIGLSVGQSVASVLAMERVAGEIRVADFDTLELSNLNRIRSGTHNVGLNKAILVAREIAETDPFIEVKVFTEGIHEANIDAFLGEGGKLDILIEECDDVFVKLLAREKAKEYAIPVLMEASDRCTVDIERFDLDPNRPILHGLIGDVTSADLKQVTDHREAIGIMLEMVEADHLSARLKASIIEIGRTIGTWPQLASDVVMGGAVTANLTRQIFLDHFRHSGRYNVDLDEVFEIPNPGSPAEDKRNDDTYRAIVAQYLRSRPDSNSRIGFAVENLKKWIEAVYDPVVSEGHLFLFGSKVKISATAKSESIIIAGFIAELLGNGAAVTELYPVPGKPGLVAVIRSGEDDYIREGGLPDFDNQINEWARVPAGPEHAAAHFIEKIRHSLLSEYGLAQLSDNLNPWLSGNTRSELLLRLVRQRGVGELLNKWHLGKGLDPVLEKKLDHCVYTSVKIANEPNVLLEFGGALARKYKSGDNRFTIAALFTETDKDIVGKDTAHLHIGIGLRTQGHFSGGEQTGDTMGRSPGRYQFGTTDKEPDEGL